VRRVGIFTLVMFLGALFVSACGGSGGTSQGSAGSSSTAAGSAGRSSTVWPASATSWLKSNCESQQVQLGGGQVMYNCNCIVNSIKKHVSVSQVEKQEQRAKAGYSYQDWISTFEDSCLNGNSANS
jgi:hypothetical protein